ncbi:MAG TPA: chemotaxis protein CheB [Longimicrobiales bacterium]|nr:chemotaxis protein CheB [Longimicrobiales bacterium]
MTSDNRPSLPRKPDRVPVVGVGASAGGLKALQQLVESIPPDAGLAYVVILHLDPKRASRMAELLQDRTQLKVTQIGEPQPVAANNIYIIPPSHDVAMGDAALELRDRGERAEHAPVDLFFRTLAEAYGSDAVGVVLSGTGADGTAGIRYIREAGGITVAQLPAEAEYEGMPASAISTGLIDVVLPSAQIVPELIRLRGIPSRLSGIGEAKAATEAGLARVFAALRGRTGHDFSQYKRSTVLRRLERRLLFNGLATLTDYITLLESNDEENQALLRDLLISVSSFFRDPDAFDALAAAAPELFEGKGPADAVRVWVVGCATGEEAYSIAMVLAEYAATLTEPPRIQLFATDIDEKGYGSGREGLYSAAEVAGISAPRLRRFFTSEAGGYRVVKPLRELVLFAGHNVLHDPPFSRMDLISCRNLFIYLEQEAQERALETFHFALSADGLLFLGASEGAGNHGLFTPAGKGSQRLFRRSSTPHRVAPRKSSADPIARPGTTQTPAPAATTPRAPADGGFSYAALHVRMLEQYAPASAIVDERLQVVHLSAHAGRYLTLSAGAPSHDLLQLARGELRRALRSAVHQAFERAVPITHHVRMHFDDGVHRVSVQVRPTPADGADGRFALIVFDDTGAAIVNADGNGAAVSAERGDGQNPVEVELEEELRQTRDLLESTSAAHDRTMTELQTVNEELLSINEEQKAASEELETSREEIQSINEELTTINQEHQSTIEELKRTNADLQNLIESTEIGTIFLDRTMRIRRFTPAVCRLFNFVASDPGRPLSDITHRLHYPTMSEDVASVLKSLSRIEREVGGGDDEWFIVRINPYLSLDGGHDGAVLTFFDNTAQHRAAEELRHAKITAEAADLAKGTFLATLSHEFRTPLNGILGYADLLTLDGPLNEAQLRKVERIRQGGWHLASMIDEILSFAKLDAGRETVDYEDVDARAVALEARALVEPSAIAKGLTFELDGPPKGVAFDSDGPKVRQILINLCGNAVKYTDKGAIRLHVHAEQDRMNFDLSDTGAGIADEHLDKIFNRFWQVDGASTRSAGGLGIGLAAAREYARLLGGDVVVLRSALGQGSTFRLWLPRVRPVAAGDLKGETDGKHRWQGTTPAAGGSGSRVRSQA